MHTAAGKLEELAQSILSKYQHDQGMLVAILQDIQVEHNYLPKEALELLSKTLDVPLSRVYSVATFFKALSLTPRGRHLINVYLGTACYVRGAIKVLETLERDLDVKPGETTNDLKFTLGTVNCVGVCALGPVVIVDGEYHGQMNSEKAKAVLENYA